MFSKIRIRFLVALALTCMVSLAAVAAPATTKIAIREYESRLDRARLAMHGEDVDSAFGLTQEVACWGDKHAQFMLGMMYLEGKGVEEDVLSGYAWVRTAAESGIEDFEAMADKLYQAIPEKYRSAAQAGAEAITAQYGMQATGVRCNMEKSTGSHRRQMYCRIPYSLRDTHLEIVECQG